MRDVEGHGGSSADAIEVIDHDLIATAQCEKDAKELIARTGYKQVMKRRWTRWGLLGIVQAMAATWTTQSGALQLGIYEGGPSAIIYGFILMTIGNGIVALSLAELVSAWPTSGGAYYWIGQLGGPKYGRFLSWVVGYFNTFSWIVVMASVCAFLASQLMGCVLLYDETYDVPRWTLYIIYMAALIGPAVYAIFLNKTLPYISRFMLYYLCVACVVSILMIVIVSRGNYATNKFVWATWVNETGWSNAACFFTGLINPAFAYGLLDGTIHLCEESEDPERNIPLAILSQVGIGFVTGIGYIVAMMYSISDLDAVLNSPNPTQEVYLQSMQGGRGGAFFLQFIVLLGLWVACCDLQLTQARMTWSFSRDGGMPFSTTLSKINRRFGVPLYAQLFGDFIVLLLGFLYLFADEAFNALVGSSLVLSCLALIIPITAHLFTGRKVPTPGPFWLGKFGLVVNFLSVCWLAFQIVVYQLPYFLPVVGYIENMNWTVVVVGGIFIICIAMWFVQGRKHYTVSVTAPATFDDVLDGHVVDYPSTAAAYKESAKKC
ncbi:hypothetical protein BP5796_02067 [Coleophoma crateriformis]|uniref:Choline transporter n=1 Tax=Coleophoma crateriformis TaxID=565419 RepID=A0A3D8T278_9HELO|nr:hypothetical protein BP5796_02067 [Coleophoma crateriformis]